MGFNPKTFKSLEFITLVLGVIGPWLVNAASDAINTKEALTYNAIAAAVYALARGLAKMNSDTKDYWATSEFYVAILGSAAAAVGVLSDNLSGTRWSQLQGLILAAAAIANGLRKEPLVATGALEPVDLAPIPGDFPADGDDTAVKP